MRPACRSLPFLQAPHQKSVIISLSKGLCLILWCSLRLWLLPIFNIFLINPIYIKVKRVLWSAEPCLMEVLRAWDKVMLRELLKWVTEASAIGHGPLLKAATAFYQELVVQRERRWIFEVNLFEVNPIDRLCYQWTFCHVASIWSTV